MAKSVWDEIKDLFKSDDEKAEERQKELDDALERERDVVEQLDELDRQYRESVEDDEDEDLTEELEKLFPSDSGYREKEYDAQTDEQIEQQAKAEKDAEKQQDTEELQRRFESDKQKLEGSKDSSDKSLKDSYAELEKLYEELKQRTRDDALKRGVARGSIVSSEVKELENDLRGDRAQARQSYLDSVNDIDRKLKQLQADKDSALEQLDIAYAAELAQRIEKLKADRDKQVEKYEEYNQDVRRKNAAYAAKRERDIAEYLRERDKEKQETQRKREELENIVGYTGEKRENYAKRYEIAYQFYSSLSPDIASDALMASPNMRYYLGEYHYNQLLRSLKDAKAAAHAEDRYL